MNYVKAFIYSVLTLLVFASTVVADGEQTNTISAAIDAGMRDGARR